MNKRSFIILIAFVLAFISVSGFVWSKSFAGNSDQFLVIKEDTKFKTADFKPNGTLLIDGEVLTFENDEVMQAGSIVVTNSGKLILRNSSLQFEQLAPYQYYITVEKSSEILLENSVFSSKYPVSWFIESSNVTLDTSTGIQCFLKSSGTSILSLDEGRISGVSLTGTSKLTANLSDIGTTRMGSTSLVTLLDSTATTIHASDSSTLSANILTCSGIILSDDSTCTLINTDAQELHHWGWAESTVSGGAIQDIGLYDDTSISISDCSAGYFLIRSSLSQTLYALSIDELHCSHNSEVSVINCTIGSLYATGYSNMLISDCEIEEGLCTDWSTGLINQTTFSSVTITMFPTWEFFDIEADYFECSREAFVTIRESWIYDLYAWSFNLTTWSYGSTLQISDSFIHSLRAGWWTINIMSNCIVEEGNYYHTSIAEVTHTNFTNVLYFQTDAIGNLTLCNIELLYTRHSTNLTLKNSAFSWRIEPDFDTQSITNLPYGSIRFWHPITNGSFDNLSYNIAMYDCLVESLEISVGRYIVCDVQNSVFSFTEVFDNGYVNFTDCILTDFNCYGEANLLNCSIEDFTATAASVGYAEDCQVETMNVYGNSYMNVKNCNFSHAQVGGWESAFLRLEDSNSTSFWASGTGVAELDGCYVWQIRTYNYIQISATDCVIDIWYNGYVDYPIASATNCTLGTITAIAHTTLTLTDCDVDYYSTRDSASTLIENCSFNQFITAETAHVTLRGNFTWTTYYSIRDDSIVSQEFILQTTFENGTTCGFIEYSILTSDNITLTTGTTTSQGMDTFVLAFSKLNNSQFAVQYQISVDTGVFLGDQWFNTSSMQPIIVIIEQYIPFLMTSDAPYESEEQSPSEERGTSDLKASPPARIGSPQSEWLHSKSIVDGLVVGSIVCVTISLVIHYQPSHRIINERRKQCEKT
jgi:hypothetical protein